MWVESAVWCDVWCDVWCVCCRSFVYSLDHETNQLRPVDLPIRVKLEQVRARVLS